MCKLLQTFANNPKLYSGWLDLYSLTRLSYNRVVSWFRGQGNEGDTRVTYAKPNSEVTSSNDRTRKKSAPDVAKAFRWQAKIRSCAKRRLVGVKETAPRQNGQRQKWKIIPTHLGQFPGLSRNSSVNPQVSGQPDAGRTISYSLRNF